MAYDAISLRGFPASPGAVLAQAAGPLGAGILRDATGAHATSLSVFAMLSAAAVVAALLALPPELASQTR